MGIGVIAGSRGRWLLAIAISVAALFASPPRAAATYAQNFYDGTQFAAQATNCSCVNATSYDWLKLLHVSSQPTQVTIENYIAYRGTSYSQNTGTGDKYAWMWIAGQRGYKTCTFPGTTTKTAGHDPRGQAWAMWAYTPGGYYYNDYWYANQTTADWELVYGMRGTGEPVAAYVAYGKHVLLVVGYQALNDPFTERTQGINGFYVIDPWYKHSYASGLPPAGAYDGPPTDPNYGIPWGTYIAKSDWDSRYFLHNWDSRNSADPYQGEGPFWISSVTPKYGYFTTVVRATYNAATYGQPTNSPPQTYGDYRYNQLLGAATVAREDPAPVVAASVDAAVRRGLAENGLSEGGRLGADLSGYSIGESVHVDSLSDEAKPYELVELRVKGHVAAIAMVTDTQAGYEFAGVTTADFGITSHEKRQQLLERLGLGGSGRLVWGWTDEMSTPFTPFVVGSDASDNPVYIGMDGRHNSLHVLRPRR